MLQGLQLKTAKNDYRLEKNRVGLTINGTNVYGILRAPRGDATEAIVISTSWKTLEGKVDLGGVSLLLSLAGYFRRISPICKPCSYSQVGLFGLRISSFYSLPNRWRGHRFGWKLITLTPPDTLPPFPLKVEKSKQQYKLHTRREDHSMQSR